MAGGMEIASPGRPSIDATVRMLASRDLDTITDAEVTEALTLACREENVTPAAAMACARALLKSGRLDEATVLYEALATHLPGAPQGPFGLARIAMRRREWAVALEHWAELFSRFSSKVDASWMVDRATCLLELAGPSEETYQAARSAHDAFPNDLNALVLLAKVADLRADHLFALTRWKTYFESPREAVAAYFAALDYAAGHADFDLAREIVARAPETLAASAEFRIRVLLRLYEFTLDEAAGLALIDALFAERPEETASSGDLIRVGHFLIHARQPELAAIFLAKARKRHPRDQRLASRYLTAVWMARGVEALREEKVRVLAELSPDAAVDVLRAMPTLAALDADEIERLFAEAVANEERGAAFVAKFLLTNVAGATSAALSALENAKVPSLRLAHRMLIARQSDADRLTRMESASGLPTGAQWPRAEWPDHFWRAFEDASEVMSRTTEQDIKRMIARQDGGTLVLEAAQTLLNIVGRAEVCWVNSRVCYYDAASLAGWCARRVADRQPTAIIRLGDGEGCFLPYAPQWAPHQPLDQRATQLGWWGEQKFAGASADAFCERLQQAVGDADAIGLMPIGMIMGVLSFSAPRQARGNLTALHYLDSGPRQLTDGKLLVSNNFPVDLDQWRLFGPILSAASAVSVVSCHDLSGYLRETHGVDVRRWFNIPEHKRFSAMFGRDDAARVSQFYPDIFEKILEDISPIPGEVYLIAAGILGKIIAQRVRERGGCALDIGSLADYWAGYVTRAHGGG